MPAIKKIVVIGPESTGKSTLCEQLAQHYHTTWCPEYAREYLTNNGAAYTFEDLMNIAKGQIALEKAMVNGMKAHNPWSIVHGGYKPETPPQYDYGEIRGTIMAESKQDTSIQQPTPIFIDTDLYVMKVWCEYVFNKCHHYILEQIATRQYDLYLLCDIDLPWQADPLREYPDEKPRQELYRIYKDILVNQTTAWVTISGNYNERLQTAITAVDKLLKD